MTNDRDLLQQTLGALESECDATKFGAAEAIRARLEQPEPKPVAWITVVETRQGLSRQVNWEKMRGINHEPLYTTPPQREWQGLTDDEIIDAANMAPFETMVSAEDYIYIIARSIEAKLKEKNA